MGASRREGGTCASCHEDMKDEGEEGWCEGSHSGGDKVLDSSLVTMPRMSKSKHSEHTHLGTQRATLAVPTFGQDSSTPIGEDSRRGRRRRHTTRSRAGAL